MIQYNQHSSRSDVFYYLAAWRRSLRTTSFTSTFTGVTDNWLEGYVIGSVLVISMLLGAFRVSASSCLSSLSPPRFFQSFLNSSSSSSSSVFHFMPSYYCWLCITTALQSISSNFSWTLAIYLFAPSNTSTICTSRCCCSTCPSDFLTAWSRTSPLAMASSSSFFVLSIPRSCRFWWSLRYLATIYWLISSCCLCFESI